MKKRVLVPIKILAFAITTACTAPEPVKAPPGNNGGVGEQGVAPAEATSMPVSPAPTATTTAPAIAEEVKKELPIDIGDPNINTLRAKLAKDKNALSHPEQYRPLCDNDGYPLVGNLNRKGPIEFEPSQICRAIRESKKGAR